ncbi:MAG: hypothetical protein F4Z57_10385 [Gemmatimonadetes bacterium]|nr:hypothetical protein [Gemmatimonadota bacterium]MYC73768.1 hypothetical protein [Gemmatimonadota bacterium]MYI63005.1 hypothetical protein [Gemmatimonadota bacterium]
MAPETSEITTRDVLQQINRRLELIESDVRAVSEKLDVSFQTLNDKIDASAQDLDGKWEASTQGLTKKIDTSFQTLHEKIDTYFRWTIGIVLASWLSTMGAILFKGAL